VAEIAMCRSWVCWTWNHEAVSKGQASCEKATNVEPESEVLARCDEDRLFRDFVIVELAGPVT
jgi:hypothetical protein